MQQNSTTPQVRGGGVGFAGLLALLFIGLKITGEITWPWIWVLSPLWIPFAILAAFLLLIFVPVVIVGVVRARRERR